MGTSTRTRTATSTVANPRGNLTVTGSAGNNSPTTINTSRPATKGIGRRVGKKGSIVANGISKPTEKTERKPGRLHSKLTHAAGVASAATLGYIAGNVPGAVAAGTAFHHFHKKSKEKKMQERSVPK